MRQTLLAVMLFSAVCPAALSHDTQEFPETSGNAFVRLCSVIDKENLTQEELENDAAGVGFLEGVFQGMTEEAIYAHAMTDKERAHVKLGLLCGDVMSDWRREVWHRRYQSKDAKRG